MIRQSRIPRWKSISAYCQLGWLLLLVFCGSFIQSSEANALTGPRLGGAISLLAAPIKVSDCDGGRDCAHYPPARRWDPEPEPEPRPIIVKPCERVEYRPRVYAYAYRTEPAREVARDPGYVESTFDDDYCGIRCWYRRIRAGFCGRGCDYYQFRLNHFPSGRFIADRGVRVACATD